MIAAIYLLVAAALFSPAQAQQRAIDRELVTAGFVMRPADTPGKMKQLRALKPQGFSARTKDGARYYIYADATDCKCAFVGSQQAFDSYRRLLAPPAPPPGMREFSSDATRPGLNLEFVMVDDMNEDAGLMDADDIFHLRF